MSFYNFAKGVVSIFFHVAFRIEKIGVENIPADSSAILAVNHRSNWDVVTVGLTTPRNIRYMAKAEMFKNKFLDKFFRSLGAFPVHRGRGDIGAIKSALNILSQNNIMLMFPEGKRVRDGAKGQAKAGVAMIATRAGVPIIPVHIVGKYKFMSKIKVIYGKPIVFDEFFDKKLTMDELQGLSNQVLDTIYKLEA